MSQFENLVFEGGGVKGIAYVGALAVLEERGVLTDIRRVGGTSAGAIAASLVALGADTAKARRIVTTTPFSSFEDSDFGIFRDLWRLIHRYGWYKGDAFATWIRRQIAALSGNPELDFATLADWAEKAPDKYRRLYVIGTDLSDQRAKVYSADTTPDVPIWLAARISMSLPLVFASVERNHDVWVDGGLTWNYPIDLFDHARYVEGADGNPDDKIYNKATLGFRVDTRAEIVAAQTRFGPPAVKVDNLISYAKALIGFMIDAANHAHLEPRDWQRTVFIESHGISTTDFDLSDQQISTLIESGRLGTEAYFQWFDDAGEKPLNRL
ncbi:MAG: patatin-like phospholipase family protein [Gammaproteobacteria bacterium]|nr:patatin-like phospholipase family protein [Gammaproteobacteria bacterium]